MSQFSEHAHPRGGDGKFAAKTAPELEAVDLSDGYRPRRPVDPAGFVPAPVEERTAGFTASHGVRFNVRVVESGESYGATNSLTAEARMVEFYDSRYPFTERGQFVSRYYVEDLMLDREEDPQTGGLNLDGGVPAWAIDATTMHKVRGWIGGHLPQGAA